MTICPIAIAVGCARCAVFSVCPVKGVIGDYKRPMAASKVAKAGSPAPPAAKARKKRPKRSTKR